MFSKQTNISKKYKVLLLLSLINYYTQTVTQGFKVHNKTKKK